MRQILTRFCLTRCLLIKSPAVQQPNGHPLMRTWCRRLMNHACEPTLLPEEVVQLRGYFRIVFIALRHIYPGEELTFDYSAPCLPLNCVHRYRCNTASPLRCESTRRGGVERDGSLVHYAPAG